MVGALLLRNNEVEGLPGSLACAMTEDVLAVSFQSRMIPSRSAETTACGPGASEACATACSLADNMAASPRCASGAQVGCIACPIALWQRLSLRQYAANGYRLKDDGTKPSATDAHRRHFVICALRLSVRIDRVDGGIRPRWKGRSLGVPSGDAGRARLPDLYGDGVDRGEFSIRGPGVHRRACPDVGRRHPSRAWDTDVDLQVAACTGTYTSGDGDGGADNSRRTRGSAGREATGIPCGCDDVSFDV